MSKHLKHEEIRRERRERERAEKEYMRRTALKYFAITLLATSGCVYEAMKVNMIFLVVPTVVSISTAIVFSAQAQVVFKTNLTIVKEAMKSAPHIYQDINLWNKILPRQAQISFNWLLLGFVTLILPILLAFKNPSIVTLICSGFIVYVIYSSLGLYYKLHKNAGLILNVLQAK